MSYRYRPPIWALAWAAAVASGFALVILHETEPGDPGLPVIAWPAETRLAPDPDRGNLVMLVHPRCPCSRASLAELGRIMERSNGALTAHVLMLRPRGAPEGWERSPLWRQAQAIPGVRVSGDPGGIEAGRFGAATSGHVLLFDRKGRRLFSGGITRARGVEGAVIQADTFVGLVSHRSAGPIGGQVFGCPLMGPLDRGRVP